MHNLLIVMFVVLLIGACIGSASSGNPAKNPEQEIKPVENFQVIGEWQKVKVPWQAGSLPMQMGIVVDKKTGVEYIICHTPFNDGITITPRLQATK